MTKLTPQERARWFLKSRMNDLSLSNRRRCRGGSQEDSYTFFSRCQSRRSSAFWLEAIHDRGHYHTLGRVHPSSAWEGDDAGSRLRLVSLRSGVHQVELEHSSRQNVD